MAGRTKFYARLEHLRYRDFISRATLARKLHVSAAAVGRWERGETEPGFAMLIKMAEIFNVSADYLLGLTDDDSLVMPYDRRKKEKNK